MKIAIPRERQPHEARVAATPETVKKFAALGCEVIVEAGAGLTAMYPDADYAAAGAKLASSLGDTLKGADIVLKVQRPLRGGKEGEDELKLMKAGAMLVAMLAPHSDEAGLQAYAKAGVDAFAMELMPRITRAQSMDVLSSQSNLAGYKAVIDAANEFNKAFPMMMTAAGTVAPARVLVMGAGVAGLQAIATARRLGAIVSGTDVRLAAKEQVESLGAKFVMVDSEEAKEAETAAGYAKEMSDDYKKAQAALIAETIKKQDIVICTALIPGRKAPILITAPMVKSMRPGSVIVDLAVEMGGNCALSKAGEVVNVNGVKIIGRYNVPSLLSTDSSALYAKNLLNFLTPLIDAETKSLKINWEDQIITGTALTRDGKVIHPSFTPKSEKGS
jgi:NAD(P) transhydrogenase subunit alpha